MAKRVAGTCYIKVDGAQLEISGGVEVPSSDVKREPVMGLSGVAGYKETALVPYVKVSAIVRDDFPLQALRDGTAMTITAELANGMVYTLSGAFMVGDAPVKADDGGLDLEFNGERGQWK